MRRVLQSTLLGWVSNVLAQAGKHCGSQNTYISPTLTRSPTRGLWTWSSTTALTKLPAHDQQTEHTRGRRSARDAVLPTVTRRYLWSLQLLGISSGSRLRGPPSFAQWLEHIPGEVVWSEEHIPGEVTYSEDVPTYHLWEEVKIQPMSVKRACTHPSRVQHRLEL